MFYGGKIIVLDEFPANKVEELISFARTTKWSTYASYNQTQPSVIPNLFPQAPSRLIVCGNYFWLITYVSKQLKGTFIFIFYFYHGWSLFVFIPDYEF